MQASREQVYVALDSERAYQDSKWGDSASSDRPGHGERSIDEFALYLSGYATKLAAYCSEFGNPHVKLGLVRKITALGVACMEQHGAPHRMGH